MTHIWNVPRTGISTPRGARQVRGRRCLAHDSGQRRLFHGTGGTQWEVSLSRGKTDTEGIVSDGGL